MSSAAAVMEQSAINAPGGSLGPWFLAEVIAAAPAPLWVIGSDWTVQLANNAAISVLGYASVVDVLGGPSHDLLHQVYPDGSVYPTHACPILSDTPSAGDSGLEWFIRRSGRPIQVTWSTRPIGGTGARLLSFDHSTGPVPPPPADDRLGLQRLAASVAVPSRAALGEAMLRHIRDRFADPKFSVQVLAAEFHLSVRLVQAILAERGLSPATEIRRTRLKFARELLSRGSTVQFAAQQGGFTDAGTFARAFRRHYGQSPSSVAREVVAVGSVGATPELGLVARSPA